MKTYNSVRKTFYMFLSWLIFSVTLPVSVEAVVGSVIESKHTLNSEVVKQDIAVLDIKGYGISEFEATALTNYLRSELRRSDYVNIVGPGKVRKIRDALSQRREGLSKQSIEKCKSFGISHLVTGDISKMDQTNYLSFSVFNVKTGSIERTYNRSCDADVNRLMTNIQNIAKDITGLIGEKVAYLDYYTEPVSKKSPFQKTKSLMKGNWTYVGLAVVGAGLALSTLSNDGPPKIGMPPAFPEVPNQ